MYTQVRIQANRTCMHAYMCTRVDRARTPLKTTRRNKTSYARTQFAFVFVCTHSCLLLFLLLLFLVCVPKLVTTNWIPISFRSHVPILYTISVYSLHTCLDWLCLRLLLLYYYLLLFLLLLLFVHILGLRLCLYDIYLLVFGCDRRFMCDYHHDYVPPI